MVSFPLWVVSIFLLINFIVRVRVHTRMGRPVIYTLATNVVIWSVLLLWMSFAHIHPVYHDWALGLAFSSTLFWNILLMYATRNRHIK